MCRSCLKTLCLISAVVVGWGDEPKWGGLARPAHRFMCFDKATGELRWLNGTGISPYDTTYSTPTVMPIAGQQALVFASGDGEVWAIQPRTGKHIWHFPLSRAGINVSPLVAPDGKVYMSHSEENMFGNTQGAVVALDGTKSGDLTGTELWQHLQIMAGKSSPVLYDGRLYVVDDRAKLFIYDAQTRQTDHPQGPGQRHAQHAARGRRQDLHLHEQRPVVDSAAHGAAASKMSTACGLAATKATARRSSRTAASICRRPNSCTAWHCRTSSRRPIRSRRSRKKTP